MALIDKSAFSLETFQGLAQNAGLVLDQNTLSYVAALYIQAALETNGFTSRLYKDANNMYGMRPSSVRTKFYSGIENTNNGQFASYDSLVSSLEDRINLDQYNGVAMPTSISLPDLMVWLDAVLSKGYVPLAERGKYRELFTVWYHRLVESYGNLGEYAEEGEEGNGLFNFGSGNGGFFNNLLNWKIFSIPIILILGFLAWKFKIHRRLF